MSGNNERFLLDDFTVTHNVSYADRSLQLQRQLCCCPSAHRLLSSTCLLQTKTIVGLVNLLLLQPRVAASAPSSSSSSSSSAAAVAASDLWPLALASWFALRPTLPLTRWWRVCLHPEALQDRRGLPLKAAVVRVGAGKRGGEKGREAVKSQHDGADVESVSLDRLVELRLKQEKAGRRSETERQPRTQTRRTDEEEGEVHPAYSSSGSSSSGAEGRSPTMSSEISSVKEQLDAVHALLLKLEERLHADAVH